MKSTLGAVGLILGIVLATPGCNKKADAGPAGNGSVTTTTTAAPSAATVASAWKDPGDDPSPANAARLPAGEPTALAERSCCQRNNR